MFETKFSTNDQKFETVFDTAESSFQADFMNGGVIVGIDGASAYELAVENGFEGTVEEWLASLKGDKGDRGKDGYTPIKGVDYFDGKDGKDGVDGYTPIKGVDYFDGAAGKDGKDGYTPIKGVDYFDGKDGYTPIKGADYFTQADIDEMVAAVKNQLIVEQWTFTLMDDSVVTKDVVME